ncbi:flagellar basal body rod protein FlgB [Gilvimarinus agarilyticus]|uniref:flagellar basal body rod protein FlgB n=1 Tax=unclassified Gilvimarinus TaxID=2642066 RepID=UPI001C09BDA9|nr:MULTISPECIES: flagellar basal body rod protein FlgB [unclassified Gilvimarinus]MBU2887260.1 flagellar basal body rod protein FlgB [Gilvimarinus agarilyticus]MDO6571919.1 flagellar basal body rod protein FlgB [Gilvimarinus sp. 2_MG-2023]MDO6745988.1 flagellar basal body rod protein FlgB [Gilvimarinus sp. 1_MG-2023]
MAISFDQALGAFEPALKLRSQRAEVLANNLANADTPGFKSRDFDFHSALAKAAGNMPGALAKTDEGHLNIHGSSSGSPGLDYRTPHQPSVDGNTVEDQVEHAEFMKNALEFQTSFMLLNKKFKGLSKALTGQ